MVVLVPATTALAAAGSPARRTAATGYVAVRRPFRHEMEDHYGGAGMRRIRRTAAVGAVMTTLMTVVMTLGASSATALSPSTCTTSTMYSQGNGRYVSAEVGYGVNDYRYGMLRARATQVGNWEKFEFCPWGDYYTIKSLANNLYVSAEKDYTGANYGMLRARAAEIGNWELFRIDVTSYYPLGTLRALANNLYVSTEVLNYPAGSLGMLRARATVVGNWEKYSPL